MVGQASAIPQAVPQGDAVEEPAFGRWQKIFRTENLCVQAGSKLDESPVSHGIYRPGFPMMALQLI